MMEIGDRIRVPAPVYDIHAGKRIGRVVYIHPQHRYFTVQFANGLKESFHFYPKEYELYPKEEDNKKGKSKRGNLK